MKVADDFNIGFDELTTGLDEIEVFFGPLDLYFIVGMPSKPLERYFEYVGE